MDNLKDVLMAFGEEYSQFRLGDKIKPCKSHKIFNKYDKIIRNKIVDILMDVRQKCLNETEMCDPDYFDYDILILDNFLNIMDSKIDEVKGKK